MQHIEVETDWSWARGGQQQAKLEAAHKDVKDFFSVWHQEYFLTTDFSTMRRKCTMERTMVELEKFLEVKDKINMLAAVTNSMFRAHEEILKA
jgi:hypothetical protein